MKANQKIILVIATVLAVMSGLTFYWRSLPKDRCTDNDRVIGNCVPAGKCGPTPSIDMQIDCNAKNYDNKFNKEL